MVPLLLQPLPQRDDLFWFCTFLQSGSWRVFISSSNALICRGAALCVRMDISTVYHSNWFSIGPSVEKCAVKMGYEGSRLHTSLVFFLNMLFFCPTQPQAGWIANWRQCTVSFRIVLEQVCYSTVCKLLMCWCEHVGRGGPSEMKKKWLQIRVNVSSLHLNWKSQYKCSNQSSVCVVCSKICVDNSLNVMDLSTRRCTHSTNH